jgi:hypothetical protein
LLEIIINRAANGNVHHTPMQQQVQYQYPPAPPHQQQRILKNSLRQPRAQTFLANSTRPPMRTNNKPTTPLGFNNHQQQQQTPIANYRQLQQQPPPVKQAGHMRNGGIKKNNNGN